MFNLLSKVEQFGNYLESLFPFIPTYITRYLEYLPIFILGFIVALFIVPILGKIAYKYGITYKPNFQKRGKEYDNPEKAVHSVETPSLGGLAVSIPILIFIILEFGITNFTFPIIVSIGIIIALSVIDDIYVLPSYPQLFGILLAGFVIAISQIDLTYVNIPFLGNIYLDMVTLNSSIGNFIFSFVFPGDLILIGWISVCVVTVKVMGGSPGLVESNSMIAYLLIFVIAVRTMQPFIAFSSILSAGLLLGLLFFAFPPQKIFSGSSGKLFYGFLIAVFAILNDTKFASTLLILLLPIIDFSIVVIKRVIKTKDFNIIRIMKINGREHLHHHLLALGLDSKTVLLIEASITLLLASIAVLTTGAMVFFLILVASLLLVVSILIISNLASVRGKIGNKKEDEESPESKYSY